MLALIDAAKARGLMTTEGFILATNYKMLKFARLTRVGGHGRLRPRRRVIMNSMVDARAIVPGSAWPSGPRQNLGQGEAHDRFHP